jgi:cytochrome c oxidase cbb3-type subunit 3
MEKNEQTLHEGGLLENHEADGIRELDNDLPLWWFVGFVFTVMFSISYLANFHLADGPSSQEEYAGEMSPFLKADESQMAKLAEEIPEYPLSDEASLKAGSAIFRGTANNCFVCHRDDLGGQVGPNLTDEFWIQGGDLKSIARSITTGFPAKGMLPYGTGAKLTQKQVIQVASFILSMKGSEPLKPKPIDPAREKKWTGIPVKEEPAATQADKGNQGKPAASPTAKGKPESAATLKK